jgi:hypothetical protein
MWLIEKEANLIDEVLSGFLLSQTDALPGHRSAFWASQPPRLCPDGELISKLSSSPSERLKKAWQNHFANALHSALTKNDFINITSDLTALALASYNFAKICCIPTDPEKIASDPAFAYSLQLCQKITPAADNLTGTLYDSLIQPLSKLWHSLPEALRKEKLLLSALLHLNPLSELKNLDLRKNFHSRTAS